METGTFYIVLAFYHAGKSSPGRMSSGITNQAELDDKSWLWERKRFDKVEIYHGKVNISQKVAKTLSFADFKKSTFSDLSAS